MNFNKSTKVGFREFNMIALKGENKKKHLVYWINTSVLFNPFVKSNKIINHMFKPSNWVRHKVKFFHLFLKKNNFSQIIFDYCCFRKI